MKTISRATILDRDKFDFSSLSGIQHDMLKCFRNIEKSNKRHTNGIKKTHHRFFIENRRIQQHTRDANTASPVQKRVDSRIEIIPKVRSFKGNLKRKDFRRKLPTKEQIMNKLQAFTNKSINLKFTDNKGDINIDLKGMTALPPTVKSHYSYSPQKRSKERMAEYTDLSKAKNISMAPGKYASADPEGFHNNHDISQIDSGLLKFELEKQTRTEPLSVLHQAKIKLRENSEYRKHKNNFFLLE
ncbi:unnamed protein product [Moneuplotes crassus]|uniref:Uncharacterized protein n=1 Tax=Euplotes crassus TaxID=5936 RepID=A0AAD1UDR3_EUPCR|nr:unnamed protein product [Moneuplotes crassus]